ncbi:MULTISPECIES: thioesterase II family protein [unclassified Streptomyces]|uniref:thioesterase II family protein n=1 Tax=unclassified Streptomyces TaxID=2593676 RepID=UPI002E2E2A16|nr:alpha/beta fold hydrolase [Streptomyces sp. NBC_01429]
MTSAGGAPRAQWFTGSDADPDAPFTAFVFPHAGGSAAQYRSWSATLPPGIDVRVLQLPGRQERFHEAALDDLDAMVEALQDPFEGELDGRPYLLFGHSFGALLAYRLAVTLVRDGGTAPALLGVSGWAPGPAAGPPRESVAGMSDDELLDRVAELGMMPHGVSLDPATLATVLPALRGDLLAAGGFLDDQAPVPCPVAAYGGADDPLLPSGGMDAWARRGTAFLGTTTFTGGHFYLFDHAAAVQHSLGRHLRRLVPTA